MQVGFEQELYRIRHLIGMNFLILIWDNICLSYLIQIVYILEANQLLSYNQVDLILMHVYV